MSSTSVELRSDGILINGKPVILLTSSLFYFRIPASEWRSRMRSLHMLGYNTIDVYFPWNYHELAPGQWDFDGERDVRAFLHLAQEEGLWVVARPGPYICSEWDGGALPAFLNVDPELRLRDNDPAYLQAVRSWYDHIMPILADFQVERGGSIVLLQLDNELDFYQCDDRPGYIQALRDMALAHGITAPLMACAGQGDLFGATGNVEGVAPACNVYFDSRDLEIEERVRYYDGRVRALGYPLCITETNRSHSDLRRLVAGGAKLLGPYLQVGGTDLGFTTAVNNWGDPLSLMTSHYDFGGMISPAGKVRPEGSEALVLSKMIGALGPSLALSSAQATCPIPCHGTTGSTLALHDGGWLVGLSNPDTSDKRVWFGEGESRFPVRTDLTVSPNTCPFVLLDYPLSHWNIEGRISYATAELVARVDRGNVLELTFAVQEAAELVVNWNHAIPGRCSGWKSEPVQDGWRLWLEAGTSAEVKLIGSDGKSLLIKAENRSDAGRLEKTGLEPNLIMPVPTATAEVDAQVVNWHRTSIDPCDEKWFAAAKPCSPDGLFLEQNQVYRGFGWYRSAVAAKQNVEGYLVRSGADVLSLYTNGQYLGTVTPGGGNAYVPLLGSRHSTVPSQLVVRAEIWGHSNFDDHRLPSLRLKSMRGMAGLAAIRQLENLTSNWIYQHGVQVPSETTAPDWPMHYFGGWSTTEEPSRGIYYRDVQCSSGLNVRILQFPNIQVNAGLYVNGRFAGMVNPFNPFMDISELSDPGKVARIAVVVEQDFRRTAGEVLFYQGESVDEWAVAGWGETELAEQVEPPLSTGDRVRLPVSLQQGEMAWLHGELPLSRDWERGWGLQFMGEGMKILAWVGKHLVGRIWLPSDMRPRMAAGADDRIVLPCAWLREAGGRLHLLLESVDNRSAGELREVKFILDV